MKSIYEADKDVLRICLFDNSANTPKDSPAKKQNHEFQYAKDGTLVEIRFEKAKKNGLVPFELRGESRLKQGYAALRSLWREYTWVTRGATLVLIVVAVLSIFKELPCFYAPLCLPTMWLGALTSDGTITLLTLIIAFGVGINLKLRQEKGLLDGTEHYSIGRALAYGYFSNFLIGALLHIEGKGEAPDRKSKDSLKLRVVFPRTVAELNEFRTSIEHNLRAKTKNQPIEDVYSLATQTMRRNILVVDKVAGETPEAQDFYIDFPTTLYTVQDYYSTWNTWLSEKGKPSIDDAEIARLQQRQIDEFFNHLKALSESEVGVNAVQKLGVIDMDKVKLAELYKKYFVRLEPQEMIQQLDELSTKR